MTEEEKSAWNDGYAEGYRVGKRWAEGRMKSNGWAMADILIMTIAVFTLVINALAAYHAF